jgi:pantothenate kinase
MSKIVRMYVYFSKYSWETTGNWTAFSFKTADTEHLTFVCEQDVEFDVPENYDPTAQKIAALQAEKEEAQAAFHKSIHQINEKISKLQALEYTK